MSLQKLNEVFSTMNNYLNDCRFSYLPRFIRNRIAFNCVFKHIHKNNMTSCFQANPDSVNSIMTVPVCLHSRERALAAYIRYHATVLSSEIIVRGVKQLLTVTR